MERLSGSVGKGGQNGADDVRLVQSLLRRHARWLGGAPAPEASGGFDAATDAAIRGFQVTGAALKRADGIVTPASFTFRRLSLATIPGPQHRFFSNVCWARGGGLTDQDFAAAAKALGVQVAAIRAVAEVETKRSPWDKIYGRPTILFEHAIFSRGVPPATKTSWKATNHAYDVTHPDISGHGPYGGFDAQYGRIWRAAMLDEPNALKSASYGTFQLMGFAYRECGFDSVEAFVDAMLVDEQHHLAAFVAYIRSRKLGKAMSDERWTDFARSYNGPDYRRNDYDTKMAHAFARWKGKS